MSETGSSLEKRPRRRLWRLMTGLFSIGPWLMDLFNPPPRDSLSLMQKLSRVVLVTVTLVTICVISALVLSLVFLLLQRSREIFLGYPQLLNIVTILTVSLAVNIVCVKMLFEIRRLDRSLIPPPGETREVETPLPPRSAPAPK